MLVTGHGDFVPLLRKLNGRGVRVMVIGWTYAYVDNSGRERGATMSRRLQSEATYPVRMDELIDGYAELSETQRDLVDSLFLKRRGELEEASQPAPAAASPVPPVEERPVQPQALARAPVVTERAPPASRAALERFAEHGFSAGSPSPRPTPAQAPAPERDADESEARITGRVTRVLDGYGFIKGDWGASNPFFHHSEVEDDGFDSMQPGTPVSYVEAQGDRGIVAKRIRVLETA